MVGPHRRLKILNIEIVDCGFGGGANLSGVAKGGSFDFRIFGRPPNVPRFVLAARFGVLRKLRSVPQPNRAVVRRRAHHRTRQVQRNLVHRG